MTSLQEGHIRLLRAAAVVWAPVESGAPAVLYSPRILDSEGEEVPYGDVAARAGIRADSPPTEAQKHEIDALLAGLGEAFVAFMEKGSLEPGRYSYENPLAGLPHAERLMAPSHEDLGRESVVTFELTAQHLKLLRGARWEGGAGPWAGWLGLNPKRPYGDMTYFELDMADILGEPVVRDREGHLEPGQEMRLGRLHEDMQIALQVFLRHARLDQAPRN